MAWCMLPTWYGYVANLIVYVFGWGMCKLLAEAQWLAKLGINPSSL